MQRILNTRKNGTMRSIALSIVFSSLFIAVSVGAATTISTNITTGGTLSVTGLTTLGYASSTGQSLTGNISVNGMATTTGSNGNVELRGGLTVGNATTNSLAGTILLSAQSSDPTGVTQGTIYYNSTSKVLRLFDGSSWFTTGTTSSGFLLNNNNIRLDDLTLRNMTIGTTTQQGLGLSMVTIEATTTSSIPLSLVGFSGQTAHLLDIFNVSTTSSRLFYISSGGGLFASSTGAFGGTLTVGGAITATSTLSVTGLTTLVSASSTSLSVLNALYVGGTASSTIKGDNTASTLPYASTTMITATTASTTNLIVGGYASSGATSGTLAGIIFGTCSIAQEAISATSTKGVVCTSATGITTGFKVFVSATSTLINDAVNEFGGFTVNGASSTGNNLIGVQLTNLTGISNTPKGTLNFWAFR